MINSLSTGAHNVVPVPIVVESTDWMLVSKPAHLLVHPTRPGGPTTLLDLLRDLLAFELANGGQVSLVHRLDRETSGLLLVAKTAAAARHFGLAMARRDFQKEYLALVHGWPAWGEHVVDAPLLRAGRVGPVRVWLKQAVHPDGAPAQTRFEVLRRLQRETPAGPRPFSLLRAGPRTGRLHQVRVHAAHAGHPLVGDKIYGPDEGLYLRFIETGWTPELAGALQLERHALHASRLVFTDPADGSTQDWHAPLPTDLAGFLDGETKLALDAPVPRSLA